MKALGRTVPEDRGPTDLLDVRVLQDGSTAASGNIVVDPLLRDLALGFLAENLSQIEFVWTQGAIPMIVRIEQKQRLGQRVAHMHGISSPSLPLGITLRELEVVTLLVAGLTNTEVARTLNLSVRTVTTHIDHLLRKFDAPNRSTLATIALDRGLIAVPFPAPVERLAQLAVGRMLRSARQSSSKRSVGLKSPAGDPIRIGALIPSLGRGREDALEMLNGATQAIAEINTRGGVHGRLLAMNIANVDADDEVSARTGLSDLLQSGPAAITSGYLAGQSQAMDTAAENGTPFLHSSASSVLSHIVAANPERYRNTFQFSPNDEDYTPMYVSFLNELRKSGRWQPATNRIAVVVQSRWDIVDLGIHAAAVDAAALGWELVTISVTDRRNDRSAWLEAANAVRKANAAAVMIGSYFPIDHFQFVQEYLSKPGDALLYSAYAPSIPTFRAQIGAIAEGLIWATTTGTYSDHLGASFARRYQSRFGEYPGRSHAGIAYDRIHILANAWRQADDVYDFDEVGLLLSETRFRGVNGGYVFDELEHRTLCLGRSSSDPSLSQAHTVFQIQSGKHRLISPSPYAEGVFIPPPWTKKF